MDTLCGEELAGPWATKTHLFELWQLPLLLPTVPAEQESIKHNNYVLEYSRYPVNKNSRKNDRTIHLLVFIRQMHNVMCTW
jgi:hypothetical protein